MIQSRILLSRRHRQQPHAHRRRAEGSRGDGQGGAEVTDQTIPATLAVTVGDTTYMLEEHLEFGRRRGATIWDGVEEFFTIADDQAGQFFLTHHKSAWWLIAAIKLTRKKAEGVGRALMATDLRRLLFEGTEPKT